MPTERERTPEGFKEGRLEFYLAELFERALGTATAKGLSIADAQDIAQRSTIKMTEVVKRKSAIFETDNDFFKYGSVVISNEIKDCLRQMHRRSTSTLGLDDRHLLCPSDSPDRAVSLEESKAIILEMIESLSDVEKEVTYEVFFNNVKVSDVARSRNVSPQYISKVLRRAIRKLTEKAKRYHGSLPFGR